MEERVALDKEEGDLAYFHALTLQLEYITKLVTATVVACLGEDADRHRYSLEYNLIRADSIGDWTKTLTAALTGPAAQYFRPEASNISRDLTQRVPDGDWRFSAVRCLHDVAKVFGIDIPLGAKVAFRQFFEIGATIRNRTRGHGATTSTQCGKACLPLANAIDLVIKKCFLFTNVPWAYLHRNLSGKYRVSPLLGNCSVFDYLKRTREVSLPNGVFIFLDEPVYIPLVFSDPGVHDVFVPNGNFKSGTFEVLSYITNEVRRENGTAWQDPPGRLPPSATEGLPVLDQVGNVFANLPPTPRGCIPRRSLEAQVQKELLTTDRHPIVSLTGPGGIGKTTIAIAAIEEITRLDQPPYDVILWMSARDIDLLESGPKPVAPHVVRRKDIAETAVRLLEPAERDAPHFNPMEYFQNCLANGTAGPTLFVFDNFETLESPADVFHWIDTHIRLPEAGA